MVEASRSEWFNVLMTGIVVAPDSFKGLLNSRQAASIIAESIARPLSELEKDLIMPLVRFLIMGVDEAMRQVETQLVETVLQRVMKIVHGH